MENLLDRLRQNLWTTSLAVLLAYFIFFILPPLEWANSLGRRAVGGELDPGFTRLSTEIWLVLSVVVVLFLLGLGRELALNKPLPGSFRLILPPILFSAVLVITALVYAGKSNIPISQIVNLQSLLGLIVISLLVGIFEEILFRGVLFRGALTRFRPVASVIIVSVIFGLMHYVNLFSGQPLGPTTYQVVHAGADGLMYGALRLRLGTLWPVILIHALWNIAVGIASSAMDMAGQISPPASSLTVLSVLVVLPGLLYGGYLLWRWPGWRAAKAEPQ
ncbi:MAG: CPBP family intramembrane metalloprotease [Rhodobacteraceae bacterium]|nr:CPBP family intramembrane metalloprotease [Paracoccaceae bacterium]